MFLVKAAAKGAEVLISELFLLPEEICETERCCLSMRQWKEIRDAAAWDFNQRLKAKKLAPIRWRKETRLDRLLGRELLVLAWAVEDFDGTPTNAIRNWLGLRPEERWWLYHITAAASGAVNDKHIGWRKALKCALNENPSR